MYMDFMLMLFRNLSPIRCPKGTLLYNQLEEISEVVFIEQGNIDVGFSVNNKEKWSLRLYDHSIIGAYNCIHSLKTSFMYKNVSDKF